MNVWALVWGIYGWLFGIIIGVIIAFKSHPWRWAWLMNKIRREAHGVAVLISKKFGAVPVVVKKGKDMIPYKGGLWMWEDDLAIPVNPSNGKKILEKARKISPEYVYKINDVPTIFISWDDLRPLKLEHIHDNIKIDPKRVNSALEGYIQTRILEAVFTTKKIDIRMLVIMALAGIAMIAALYNLYQTLQLMTQVKSIKGVCAAAHVIKEVNAMVGK